MCYRPLSLRLSSPPCPFEYGHPFSTLRRRLFAPFLSSLPPSLPPSLLYRQSSSPSVPLPRRVCGPRHRNSEMKFRTDFAYKFHPHPHPSTNRPLNGEQKRESNPRNERERVSTLSPVPRSSSRSLTILSSSISFLRTNGPPFHGGRRRSPPYSPNYPLPLIDIA